MDETLYQPSLKQIMHPTDLTSANEAAFAHALRIAAAAGATLDILHVDRQAHAVEWADLPDAAQLLADWGLDEPDIDVNKISTYGTEPVRPILDYLDEQPADLIVMGTHRRDGLDRWLHKEIAQKLARRRSVTSLFVPFGVEGFVSPSEGTLSLHRILVPVDWIPAPQIAIDTAAVMAGALGCERVEWTLLHVVSESADSSDMPDVRRHERSGWSWSEENRRGDVFEEILAVAQALAPDLLVMTTQGHDGFLDALRGSTTEQVLRQVSCPLLSVPALPAA